MSDLWVDVAAVLIAWLTFVAFGTAVMVIIGLLMAGAL